MISKYLVDIKIKNGEAELIKQNQRMVNGKVINLVRINDAIYRFCPFCDVYRKLERFTKTVNGYHSRCKECRNSHHRTRYNDDLNTHIRHRWYAINRRMKNNRDKCVREEFESFFKNEKCLYTNKTLKEDFLNPSHNSLLRLEIDHILPISEGGTSKIENLRVVPKFINQLKQNAPTKDVVEIEEMLFGGGKFV